MAIYKIKSVRHSGTKGGRGLPREDGKYPLMAGRTVRLYPKHISAGLPLVLDYVKDENGNDYSDKRFCCSRIAGIHFVVEQFGCIETENTIYEFEKESEE